MSEVINTNGTGYVFDEDMCLHRNDWDNKHPECPERVSKIIKDFKSSGLDQQCIRIDSREATHEELRMKHTNEYIEDIRTTEDMTLDELKKYSAHYDGVYVNNETYKSASTAVGSCIELIDAIHQRKILNGFAFCRPPGHHALPHKPCGYCIFNNAALAISHCLKNRSMKRILLVDWDIHHGQSSQHMFYDNPMVMYVSIHRYEGATFWPNLRVGDYDCVGDGPSAGYNINIPLNQKGTSNEEYIALFQQIIVPIANKFDPEMIVVSHGSDSTLGDPEGNGTTTPALFSHLIHMLQAIQPKICVILEGGYNLEMLSASCMNIIRTLLGQPCPILGPIKSGINRDNLDVIRVLQPYWDCLKLMPVLEVNKKNISLKKKLSHDEVELENYDYPEQSYNITDDYPTHTPTQATIFQVLVDSIIARETVDPPTNKLCIAYDKAMCLHKVQGCDNHPECPDRISSIFNHLTNKGIVEQSRLLPSRVATKEEILLVHSEEHYEKIRSTETLDEDQLDIEAAKYNSIYLSNEVFQCATLAVGCTLQIVDEVMNNRSEAGLSIVRPPGHHAFRDTASGFCFFNSAAVAARYAQTQYEPKCKRVVILDWDVHHGNGTQDIFYEDDSVLYISVHRHMTANFYPNSPNCASDKVGAGKGEGFNVNIGWNCIGANLDDSAYFLLFQHIILPIIYEYAPDLVIVSAGFDAGVNDPLGGCQITPRMFGLMTHMLRIFARGRLILVLEGGYNLRTISLSAYYCCESLLANIKFFNDPHFNHNQDILECVYKDLREVIFIQKKYWKSLQYHVSQPNDLDTLRWLGDRSSLESYREQLNYSQTESNDVNDKDNDVNLDIEVIVQRLPVAMDINVNQSNNETDSPAESEGVEEIIDNIIENLDISNDTDNVKLIELIANNSSSDLSTEKSSNQQDDDVVNILEDLDLIDIDEQVKPLTSPSGDLSNDVVTDEQLPEQQTVQDLSVGHMNLPREASQAVEATEPQADTEPLVDTEGDHPVEQQSDKHTSSENSQPEQGTSNHADNNENVTNNANTNATGHGDFQSNVPSMFEVTPLLWCPHLDQVQQVPNGVLNYQSPCMDCSHVGENWVCLTCYQVFCSRFVESHMVGHHDANEHEVVLSYADLTVWCYSCESYIHNQILLPAKRAAHMSKFGH